MYGVRGPTMNNHLFQFTLALSLALFGMSTTVSAQGPPPREEGILKPPDRPLSDLPGYEMPVPDLYPAFFPSLAPPLLGTAALSVVLSMRTTDSRQDLGGSVVLELPFATFGAKKAKRAPSRKNHDSERDVTRSDQGADDANVPDSGASPSRSSRIRPLVIRPRDARAAIAASRRHRKTGATLSDLEGMASRARYGSLLPTLRLRATRLIDESISLSPTSYDAERTTSRGGASLWLEARATWDLDRLVFASEEIRVTQIRLDYSTKQRKMSQRVLADLFAWQRAIYAMHDPTLSIPSCVHAWLNTQQLAASLDIATDGWFSEWSAGKTGPAPDCVDMFRESPWNNDDVTRSTNSETEWVK